MAKKDKGALKELEIKNGFHLNLKKGDKRKKISIKNKRNINVINIPDEREYSLSKVSNAILKVRKWIKNPEKIHIEKDLMNTVLFMILI